MKPFGNIVSIDPVTPQPELIRQAAELVADGRIVVFPTTCLYGLGADARNPEAVQAVFQIKQRPENQPLLILVHDQRAVESQVASIPAAAGRLMEAFWPGGLTIVFHAGPKLGDDLTAGTGKIGIRIPAHPVAAALVAALDRPLIGTSANLSGQPGTACVAALHPAIVSRSDRILDAGQLKGGLGSTVVDVTCRPLQILREGAVSAEQVRLVLAAGGRCKG